MKTKETILRKRLVSEGLPEKDGEYLTSHGRYCNFYDGSFHISNMPYETQFWYEEVSVHVLSDEELEKYLDEKIDEFIDEMKEVVNLKYGKILAISTKQDERE